MNDTIYKRKLYFKVKIDDKNDEPYFVAQKMEINTATKDDIKIILRNHGIDNQYELKSLEEDFFKHFKVVDSQIRLAGNPSFFKQSSGNDFFEDFKFQCKRMSKGSITIKDKLGNEKKWPIAIFSMYQYRA